jgi:mRNA-degrading endonuclease toxin of MazEF toxin-antitoxin module
MADQIRTIDKKRVREYINSLSTKEIEKLEKSIRLVLSLS